MSVPAFTVCSQAMVLGYPRKAGDIKDLTLCPDCRLEVQELYDWLLLLCNGAEAGCQVPDLRNGSRDCHSHIIHSRLSVRHANGQLAASCLRSQNTRICEEACSMGMDSYLVAV